MTASGDVKGASATGDDVDVGGTGLELGVKWSGPATVGFQYTVKTADDTTTATSKTVDVETTAISVGVSIMGFKVHFKTAESDFDGTVFEESTNIDASYAIPIAPGVVIGPEYRIQTVETAIFTGGVVTGVSEREKTLIAVGYSASF